MVKHTSESPFGAPAILFSPASMALSEAGGALAYSAPRGIVDLFFVVYCWLV